MPWVIVVKIYITVTWRGVKRSEHGGLVVTLKTGMQHSLLKTDLFSTTNDKNPIDLQGYPVRIPIAVLIMLSWLLSGSLRFVSPTMDPPVFKVNQVHISHFIAVRSHLTYKQFSQAAFPLRFSDWTPECSSPFSHRLYTLCHLYSPDFIILIIYFASGNHEAHIVQ
jgi:hypothetical protein